MSELDTATPDIPDILRPRPLQRAVDVNVETKILDPVSHQYAGATGGSSRFVLPASGVLDSPNATINFEICNGASDATTMYPTWSGGLGCINNITCRVGGQIISRIENAGLYATIKKAHFNHSYQSNVLDILQCSSNQALVRNINAPLGALANAGFANKTTARGFSQVVNPAIDQDNYYGCPVEAAQAPGNIQHQQQSSKLIRSLANAARGPEVSLRLHDLFPVFKEFQMPLFAMAQVEIEIEWNPTVGAAVQFQNVTNNIIVSANPVAAAASANLDAVFASNPFMSLDILHYNDAERANIVSIIQNTGMAMNFREVVHTRGINQGTAGVAPSGAVVSSSHLLGMAGKEVQNIYVVKRLDVNTNPNDELGNFVKVNRNTLLSQFKSSQMPNESYNVFINNNKIYNRNVDNPALQWTYLSQCETGAWNCLPLEYDTMDYNVDLQNVMGNSSTAGVPSLVTLAANDTNCVTAKLLSGQKHVLGIPLMKQVELGSVRGNGQLIGTAPISFEYSCNKITSAAGIGNAGPTNLDFYIEIRRSMVLTPFGVSVSDV